MSISVEMTIVISFLGFAWIFAKKIYPLITSGLDSHIQEVKDGISKAENMKNQATEALQRAYSHKNSTEDLINQSKEKADLRIKKLYEENEKSLCELRKKQEAMLSSQLQAEFIKQKGVLIDKIADLVIEKLTEKIESGECKISSNFSKEDLQKLIQG